MHKLVPFLALAFCLFGTPSAGQATMLFNSATGSALASGLTLDDYFWPTHRFEIASPTVTNLVGGYFENLTLDAISIFGAVIALSSSTDFPNSLDLSTTDVLGATVIDVMPTDGIYSGNLSLALTPGWYALVFGTGKFGADSVVGVDMIMPSLAIDLDPQLPFTAIQAGNPYGTPPQFLAQQASPQFFAAPEPATLALLAVGLVGFTFMGWRKGSGMSANRCSVSDGLPIWCSGFSGLFGPLNQCTRYAVSEQRKSEFRVRWR